MNEQSSSENHPRSRAALRTAALIALMAGAVGSMGLLLRAGQSSPRLVLALIAAWVLSPFALLAWATVLSKRWSAPTQAALYGVMLVVTLGSLATYADDARGHRRPQAAFVYVAVPPVSWALMAVVIPIAALVSGRRSRQT